MWPSPSSAFPASRPPVPSRSSIPHALRSTIPSAVRSSQLNSGNNGNVADEKTNVNANLNGNVEAGSEVKNQHRSVDPSASLAAFEPPPRTELPLEHQPQTQPKLESASFGYRGQPQILDSHLQSNSDPYPHRCSLPPNVDEMNVTSSEREKWDEMSESNINQNSSANETSSLNPGLSSGSIGFPSVLNPNVNVDINPLRDRGCHDFEFRGFTRKTCPISIRFDDLSLHVGALASKQILSGVSGKFRHSSLIGILGPSGSGKTSLLDVLSGRIYYGHVNGEVHMNGLPASIRELRSQIGFVTQNDLVHTDLTVYENLYYSAWLRLPSNMEGTQKDLIVEDTIQLLGLNQIRNQVVGTEENRGISGGQRRRVNIGIELVSDPIVLFLDEPTSGLDSSFSLEILSTLSRLSSLGRTIITTLHSPRYRAFTLLDDLLLLGEGGHVVYHGPPLYAVPYFESLGFQLPDHENAADFLSDLISGIEEPVIGKGRLSYPDRNRRYEKGMLVEAWEKSQTAIRNLTRQMRIEKEKGSGGLGGLAGRGVEGIDQSDRSHFRVNAEWISAEIRRAEEREQWDEEMGIQNKQFAFLAKQQEKSQASQTDRVESSGLPSPRVSPSFFFQLYLLIVRFLVKNWRNRMTLIFEAALTALVASIVGIVRSAP